MNHRHHLRLSANKRQALNLIKNPVWRAFAAAPMTTTKQVDLNLAAIAALDEILHGLGQPDHIATLACAANVSLVLAERGHGPECEDKVKDAQQAIMRVRSRYQRAGAIGFDGQGAQAVRDLLWIHEQQCAQAGQVEVADAMLEVHERTASGHICQEAA